MTLASLSPEPEIAPPDCLRIRDLSYTTPRHMTPPLTKVLILGECHHVSALAARKAPQYRVGSFRLRLKTTSKGKQTAHTAICW